MILTIFILSLVGGFCSGVLGVGGAVVLIPLMASVPPLVGAGSLTMSQVSGLTMIQVLASAITGWLVHRKGGFTHTQTILSIGLPMGVCSLAGAVASDAMPDKAMVIIFGVVVLGALLLLFQKIDHEKENAGPMEFPFHIGRFMLTGGVIGLVSGILGAGGGFILIPAMVRLLKVPVRVAIGSSLGIIFIGALAGTTGKIVTGQVEWLYVPSLLLGAIPASLLGSKLSHRLSSRQLHRLLMILIAVILVKTWAGILWPYFKTWAGVLLSR